MSPVITSTGVINLIFAPFGGYIAQSRRHHRRHLDGTGGARGPRQALHRRRDGGSVLLPDRAGRRHRWRAVRGLPKKLIIALAGLALMGTIGNGLAAATREGDREAAIITFLVTASGLSLLVSAVHSGVWWQACWRWWC